MDNANQRKKIRCDVLHALTLLARGQGKERYQPTVSFSSSSLERLVTAVEHVRDTLPSYPRGKIYNLCLHVHRTLTGNNFGEQKQAGSRKRSKESSPTDNRQKRHRTTSGKLDTLQVSGHGAVSNDNSTLEASWDEVDITQWCNCWCIWFGTSEILVSKKKYLGLLFLPKKFVTKIRHC